jgi:hypothetical protein
VAIVLPRSSEPWDPKPVNSKAHIEDATNNHLNNNTVDYMAEVADLYLALQHANVPVDFVDEEDLSASALKNYRIIYLTEPNLPVSSATGLLQWVRRGGFLVRSPGSGTRDQYNEPSAIFPEVLGVREEPRERTIFASLKELTVCGRVRNGAGEANAVGPRNAASSKHESGSNAADRETRGAAQFGSGTQVLGSFEDGQPAVVRTKLGAGRVIHFSWFPGLSYAASESGKKDKLPAGFSEVIREWIVLPTRLAKVDHPVVTDRTMVETPMLLTKNAATITLLNWTGENVPRLAVTARLPFKAARVESVRQGALRFQRRSHEVRFDVALQGGDIILVRGN